MWPIPTAKHLSLMIFIEYKFFSIGFYIEIHIDHDSEQNVIDSTLHSTITQTMATRYWCILLPIEQHRMNLLLVLSVWTKWMLRSFPKTQSTEVKSSITASGQLRICSRLGKNDYMELSLVTKSWNATLSTSGLLLNIYA